MDTRTYISDNLIKLVGGSDDLTIDFVLQTAKTAKSPNMLFDKLSTMLDSGDAELQRFSAVADLADLAQLRMSSRSSQRKSTHWWTCQRRRRL
jgi:hypothetical protein